VRRRNFLGGAVALAACRPQAGLIAPASEAAASLSAHRARQRRLAFEDGEIAYVDEGRGPPVVLVHGVPTSSWMYRHLIDQLVAAGNRVVAPDLIGWGSSLGGFDPTQTGPGRQAEAILALTRALGLRTWTHICHDVGGPVSFELLGIAPTVVRHLVVLDTFVSTRGWDPPIRMTRDDSLAAKTLVRGFADPRRGWRWTKLVLRRGLANPRRVRDESLVEGYAVPLREGANRTLLQFMTSLGDYEGQLSRYQRILSSFEGPSSIVWGRQDRVLDPSEQVAAVQRCLGTPSTRTAIVADAGHFLAEERPDVIVSAVGKIRR
jgi:pimeloyl-ACP methyl ester carboxylesterase